jgi:tetratricopeptide (TPR) repeat protein
MARAAAKRRQPVRHEADKRRHKDSGGQRFEDTLFFNRLRKKAKWVFVFLALVFGGGFVLFGVGSSNLGGGLSQLLGRGGSSGLKSINKALKETQTNSKDAKAWQDLATAYETKGDLAGAIGAWTTYTRLRPKNVDGLTLLATDYAAQLSKQTNDARAAAYDAQNAQTSTFGPPASSPLGRAYANVADPIAQAVSTSANERYNAALQARSTTANSLFGVYQRIAALQPGEPAAQLQLAQAAQDAGNPGAAIAAYQKFIKLAPYDNQVTYAKQQIKVLESQLTSAPQG